MKATKTPSTHHPRRRNVTTLMVGLKKRSHTQKSHPKVVNPRDIAGERKKKKKKNWQHCFLFLEQEDDAGDPGSVDVNYYVCMVHHGKLVCLFVSE